MSDMITSRDDERRLTQPEIDVKNLRFYAEMFRQYEWSTDIIHWGVFEQTLNEIAARIAATQADNARLREAPKSFNLDTEWGGDNDAALAKEDASE